MSQPPGSFPAVYRLTHKAEFDRVFTRPNQRCSQGVLQAIYKASVSPKGEARSAPDGGARLGLIVAKRFVPLAVQRNRIKRLIREGFRTHRAQLPAVDIIVRVVRKPGKEVSAGEVIELFGKMHHPQR